MIIGERVIDCPLVGDCEVIFDEDLPEKRQWYRGLSIVRILAAFLGA